MGEEGREGEKGMMIKFDSHSTTTTYICTSMMMVGDSTRFELYYGTVSLRLIAGVGCAHFAGTSVRRSVREHLR